MTDPETVDWLRRWYHHILTDELRLGRDRKQSYAKFFTRLATLKEGK